MYKTLKIDQVAPNPSQPRKHFNEESLQELAASIKSDGLQEPILVRPVGEKFEIIAGERRYRAHVIAGLKEIKVNIRELNDEDAFHLSVIENIQREQMTHIEEAQAFMKYVEMGYTHEKIAKKVSKSRTYVTSRLRLLKLIPEVQDWIAEGRISDGHAKKILTAKNDLCRLMETCLFVHKTEDPFEFIQMRFMKEFVNEKKISVDDITDWLEGMKALLITGELGWMRFLAQREKNGELTDELKEARKRLGLFYAEVCIVYGGVHTKITNEDIEFLFEHRKKERANDGMKAWQFYKSMEEWLEFMKENPFDKLDIDDIVNKLKFKDLENELVLY
ncbi:ParB/RepB/Spo0J family partition protein [Rossellomorea sp. BNER]|uniref:ParB/RepB/Spo0J family partition protein n=1 Tax=Rossellomorea sp. BNER TaxID=2962031 RepID=UPI003AF1ED79|nr:ParB/RepB/Spo0J family partition protein [Rossellomorea sp. BNER]